MRCAPAMLAELRQVRLLQKRSFEVDLGFNQMMSLNGLRNLPAEPEENTFVFIQVNPGIRVDQQKTEQTSFIPQRKRVVEPKVIQKLAQRAVILALHEHEVTSFMDGRVQQLLHAFQNVARWHWSVSGEDGRFPGERDQNPAQTQRPPHLL